MSSEKSAKRDDTRRRPTALVATAVALTVMMASGGVAYFATDSGAHTGSGGFRGDTAAAADSAPGGGNSRTPAADGSPDKKTPSAPATGPTTEPTAPPPSERPRPPRSPGKHARDMAIESYTVTGRTLTVRFWGGVCTDYSVAATETGSAVQVRVSGVDQEPGQVCIEIAKKFTRTLSLEGALGERAVVDVSTGRNVPRK